MKQHIIAALAVACAATATSAQTVVNNPDNRSYFGVRASFDISCPNSDPGDVYKNGAGFELGAVYNTPIVANFYFEPGLSIYYNTWSYDFDFLKTPQNIYDTSNSFRNFGIAIPLMFGYHFDFTPETSVFVFTGPETRIGLTNHLRMECEIPEANINGVNVASDQYGDKGQYNRFDLAWKVGVGLNYKNYYFAVSGALGMVDQYKDRGFVNHNNFYQNTVSVTLGYNF